MPASPCWGQRAILMQPAAAPGKGAPQPVLLTLSREAGVVGKPGWGHPQAQKLSGACCLIFLSSPPHTEAEIWEGRRQKELDLESDPSEFQ